MHTHGKLHMEVKSLIIHKVLQGLRTKQQSSSGASVDVVEKLTRLLRKTGNYPEAEPLYRGIFDLSRPTDARDYVTVVS